MHPPRRFVVLVLLLPLVAGCGGASMLALCETMDEERDSIAWDRPHLGELPENLRDAHAKAVLTAWRRVVRATPAEIRPGAQRLEEAERRSLEAETVAAEARDRGIEPALDPEIHHQLGVMEEEIGPLTDHPEVEAFDEAVDAQCPMLLGEDPVEPPSDDLDEVEDTVAELRDRVEQELERRRGS